MNDPFKGSLVLSVSVAAERVNRICSVAACPLPQATASLAVFVEPLSENAQPLAESVRSVKSVAENCPHLANEQRDMGLSGQNLTLVFGKQFVVHILMPLRVNVEVDTCQGFDAVAQVVQREIVLKRSQVNWLSLHYVAVRLHPQPNGNYPAGGSALWLLPFPIKGSVVTSPKFFAANDNGHGSPRKHPVRKLRPEFTLQRRTFPTSAEKERQNFARIVALNGYADHVWWESVTVNEFSGRFIHPQLRRSLTGQRTQDLTKRRLLRDGHGELDWRLCH